MRFAKTVVLCISMIVGLSACGKNIPAIDPQLLQNKSSILVITEAELPDTVKNTLDTTLHGWREKKNIAFEWLQNTNALTPEQITKIDTVPYDYILVAGHSLVQSALSAANQVTDKRWILLDDAVARQTSAVNTNNVVLKQVPESRLEVEWDEWVRQQLVSGRTIEWVTTSAYPIPSEWAPSEEAEYITIADADGWFPQFQFQARKHAPNWIAVYAPLDAAGLNRIKGLQFPVMNIAATRIELQWDAILSAQLELMEKNSWKSGSQPFADNEMKIVKNS
jgi:hypothetical protein